MNTRDGDPKALVAELCRQFYHLGWCTGTGGGISLRDGARIYMAPSGVQKERIQPEDVFVLDGEGAIIERPADETLKLTACARNASPTCIPRRSRAAAK